MATKPVIPPTQYERRLLTEIGKALADERTYDATLLLRSATNAAPAAMLSCLQELIRHGTEKRSEAVVLKYDHVDGYWLGTVDSNCRQHPIKDISGRARSTLMAAIVAAVEWHNQQGEKHYLAHLRKIASPLISSPVALNPQSKPS